MDVRLWPDTDGDGSIPHAEKEAWAATNTAWRVPSGGAPCLFELDDAILLEGYWTASLKGAGPTNSAFALFGDAIVGVNETVEFDPWSVAGDCLFMPFEPGSYTLTVFFTGTGSATNHGAGASLKIEASGFGISPRGQVVQAGAAQNAAFYQTSDVWTNCVWTISGGSAKFASGPTGAGTASTWHGTNVWVTPGAKDGNCTITCSIVDAPEHKAVAGLVVSREIATVPAGETLCGSVRNGRADCCQQRLPVRRV